MKWMLVADSSCDLEKLDIQDQEVAYEKVPFHLLIDDVDYTDDSSLNVDRMVDAMEVSKSSHSSCPSPDAWAELFEKADHAIAFTISSRLSGSYNSAMAARGMILEKYPQKKIEVVDSLSTGPKLVLLAQLAAKKISEKVCFDEVAGACQEMAKNVKTVFALASFHNLVQNGRVNKIAGFIAGKLNVRVIGIGTDEGRIQPKELMRGDKKVLKKIINNMEENGYTGGKMAISHCQNQGMAEDLRRMIVEQWRNAMVQILPTRGLDSYYAERHGLIVSYPGA